jgi:hypothetical protein
MNRVAVIKNLGRAGLLLSSLFTMTAGRAVVMSKVAFIETFGTVGLLLSFLISLPVVRADEWNQATKFRFSQPVQIPGRVLPAGTYLFELEDGYDREIVRISDSDRTKVLALIRTIPSKRRAPSGEAAITLAERGEGQPQAIVGWSYAGRTEGHEFLYPKQVQKELANDKQHTIVVGD